MTQPEHDAAVLAAHARYSAAIEAEDKANQIAAICKRERESAEAELRALARRKS